MNDLPQGVQEYFKEAYELSTGCDEYIENVKKRLPSSLSLSKRLDELLLNSPQYWVTFLRLVVEDASLYSQKSVHEHMERRKHMARLVKEIVTHADRLSEAIAKANEVGNLNLIGTPDYHHPFDLIEVAAELQNSNDHKYSHDTRCHYNHSIKNKLDAIRGLFDLKYFPESHYMALAFSKVAQKYEPNWDSNFTPIQQDSNKRFPQVVFVRGFWGHLKDRAVRVGSLPASILEIQGDDIAEIGNIVFDLDCVFNGENIRKYITR